MALEVMGYTTRAVSGDVEILYNSDYTGDAVTLDTESFSNGVCKAGTPVSADGKIANDNTAYGILLHDVYQERPQGTAVYYGTIKKKVAEEHSGLTYDGDMMAALKNVVFMEV